MTTGAILFAPVHYEAALTYQIKGVPFFLFSTSKFAGIIGWENVVVATDSSLILQLAKQYGINATDQLKDDEADFSVGTGLQGFFTDTKDCFITAFAGMPHIEVATLHEGIKRIADNCDLVFSSSAILEENNTKIFSVRFIEKEIRLPLNFICSKSDEKGRSENAAGITLSPSEARVYTRPEQLAVFAESEDCTAFFRTLSPVILQLLHPHPIKMLLLDIDGVLTDGGMYYTESGDEFKKFDTKDGLAIKTLTKKGFNVGFISAGKNKNLIESRAILLGVQHCYVGFEPKLGVLDGWLKELGLEYTNVLYVGDDLVDLDIFNAGVLSACPADAVKAIKDNAKIILSRKGGEGCVRELADNYLHSVIN
jgi:YrbI family 3-deoxy-D-manno-octulosonate 8-phosphate phosphatase